MCVVRACVVCAHRSIRRSFLGGGEKDCCCCCLGGDTAIVLGMGPLDDFPRGETFGLFLPLVFLGENSSSLSSSSSDSSKGLVRPGENERAGTFSFSLVLVGE